MEWNKWQGKDKKAEIEKTISNLALPWVMEESEIDTENTRTTGTDLETIQMDKELTERIGKKWKGR